MIVKIVDHVNHHDSIFDCEIAYINAQDKPYASIDIHMGTRSISLDINKDNEVIYIMNNVGKTIETYRW